MLLETRLKVYDFFKKHWKKIILAFIIWLIVFVINYFVGQMPDDNGEIDTNYKPHEPIMDIGEVPENLKNPINELIGSFVDKCNDKDYEAAYNMLSEDCRNNVYPDIENFKKYVDYVFDSKKIFNIQNFSNIDNTYVYNVTILDDILATGYNNEEDMEYYVEKYVIKNNNGNLELSIREYIGRDELTYMYEDDDMKIKITSVDKQYDTVIYNLNITNKSDKTIVYSDYTSDYEIALDTSEGTKRRADELLEPIIVEEGESRDFSVKFIIFFDASTEINGLIFDYIRLYESTEDYENGNEPIDDFGIQIKF